MTSQAFRSLMVFIGMMALVGAFHRSQLTRTMARLFAGEGGGEDSYRINKLVGLGTLQVTTKLELKKGQNCVICRCWLSKKFPMCDGAHAPHNRATGDNVGPAIVTVTEE